MLEFYFGDRMVGALSLDAATGIGETFFNHGITCLTANDGAPNTFVLFGRHTREEGASFLDLVEQTINADAGRYFTARRVPFALQ